MNRTGNLKLLAVLALAAILIILVIWTVTTYRSSLEKYLQTSESCFDRAIDKELEMRLYSKEANYFFKHFTKNDTTTYANIKFTTADTIIYLRVNRKDPSLQKKLQQYQFSFIPLQPVVVDNLYALYMAEYSLPVKASYVEYLDLEKNEILDSNAPKGKLKGYVALETDTLDILKTIGARLYVKAPVTTILQPVKNTFIVFVVLILIALLAICKLIRDVLRLHKDGFRLLRNFSYQVDHDLSKATELLREEYLKEEEATLKRAYRHLHKAKSKTEKMWEYLDNQQSNLPLNKTTFYLKPVFEELRQQFEATEHKTVMVRIRCNDDVVMNTDKKYFVCIVEELMNNSVRYSGEKVHINIITKQDKDSITVGIRDNGWGIPKEEMRDAFKFAHQNANYIPRIINKDDTGVGLGLSYLDSFVGLLGGMITVLSAKDDFTVFILIFPYKKKYSNWIVRYKKRVKNLVKRGQLLLQS